MNRSVSYAICIVAFSLLPGSSCEGQSVALKAGARQQLHFDLSRIDGMVVDGQLICLSKGRIQDPGYNQSEVVDQIIAAGPKAVPVLIGMITNTRRTKQPIYCYWPYTTIGDIAFCTLTDLFTDASWMKGTIPGIGWDDMLGPQDKSIPGWEQLHGYVRRHGRTALQAKWQRIWAKFKDQVYWDSEERCFKVKGQ